MDFKLKMTLQDREALLAEIVSDEQILHAGGNERDKELAEAGKFSVFLSAVQRVLQDIRQPNRNERRQWDGSVNHSEQALSARMGGMDRMGRRTPSPTNFLESEENEGKPLAVGIGLCEVLALFGTRIEPPARPGATPANRNDLTPPKAHHSSFSKPSSSSLSGFAPKSIAEMAVGPLADGRINRSQMDVGRLLTWLLRNDAIVPVWDHFYLCIPLPPAASVLPGAGNSDDGAGSAGTGSTHTSPPLTGRSADYDPSAGGDNIWSTKPGPMTRFPDATDAADSAVGSTGSSPPLTGRSADSNSSGGSISSASRPPIRPMELAAAHGSVVLSPISPRRGNSSPSSIPSQGSLGSLDSLVGSGSGSSLSSLLDEGPPALQDKTTADVRKTHQARSASMALQAELSLQEITVLQALAQEDSELDLATFLSWCPLLRGGCRVLDLVKHSAQTATVGASGPDSFGGQFERTSQKKSRRADASNPNHRLIRRDISERLLAFAGEVEKILERFETCTVKILHEAQPEE